MYGSSVALLIPYRDIEWDDSSNIWENAVLWGFVTGGELWELTKTEIGTKEEWRLDMAQKKNKNFLLH